METVLRTLGWSLKDIITKTNLRKLYELISVQQMLVGVRHWLLSVEATFTCKPSCDIMTCDKHLLSGIILQFLFPRSSNEIVTTAEAAAENCKFKIVNNTLHSLLSECTLLANNIEKFIFFFTLEK